MISTFLLWIECVEIGTIIYMWLAIVPSTKGRSDIESIAFRKWKVWWGDISFAGQYIVFHRHRSHIIDLNHINRK